jgi:hypothetical protein
MNAYSYALLTHAQNEAALLQDFDAEYILLQVLAYAKQNRLDELTEMLRSHAQVNGMENYIAKTDVILRTELMRGNRCVA